MKTPKFLTKLAVRLTPKPRKRYQAAVRAARPAPMEQPYEDDEPTTKLSSAFIVVLILHVVAVGGIYAFNSIKASRRNQEQAQTTPAPGASTGSDIQKSSLDPQPAASGVKPPTVNQTALRIAATHPEAVAPTPAGSASGAKPGAKTYQIKAGDNLTKIAFAFRVTSADLLAANNMKETDILRVGQTLTIPEPKAATKSTATDAKGSATPTKVADIAPTHTTPGLYFVKKGDTAHSIAKNYGITVDELIKVNKIADPKKLQLNQALKLPPRKG